MKLEVRKAVLSDCLNIFDWRTNPKNSENSYSGGDFKYSDHESWFADYLKEHGNLMLIVEINDRPCCVVRFDGELNDREVSIYMVPGWHGNGLGLQCLLLCETYLHKELQGLPCNLTAQIMNDNVASIKMFTRAGYIYSLADWYKLI